MPQLKHKFLLPIALLILSASAFSQRSTPKLALESFYKFDRSHSQVFNRRNIEERKAWLSPELYSLFKNELRREADFLKQNPTDKPFFGDGLPFRPYDELCDGPKKSGRSLTIGLKFQKARRAAATATFAYPRSCKTADTIVYTISLIKVNSKWVIDDIDFDKDTRLKHSLNRPEY